MKYKQILIKLQEQDIEAVSNLLVMAGIGGFEVFDRSEFEKYLDEKPLAYEMVDESLYQYKSHPSYIKTYAADNIQGIEIIDKISKTIKSDFPDADIQILNADDSDWKDNWKKYYKPTKVGADLWIVPAWEDFKAAEGKVLKIDPGMAFGTGTHESTQLCLELIQEIKIIGKTVLDVGCGSGILSQAAIKLGAKFADGCDIDSAAIESANQNAILNGIENRVCYRRLNLVDGINRTYDIITANIVADIILQLLDNIKTVVKNGSYFIASGIIGQRSKELEIAIKQAGFDIIKTKMKKGWAAILAQYKLGI